MTVPSKQLPEQYKEETFRYLQHFMRMGVVGNNRKEYEISIKKIACFIILSNFDPETLFEFYALNKKEKSAF